MPRNTLAGEMRERNGASGVSVNETTIEVGEKEEGLNVLDFAWFWPICMIWTLFGAIVRLSGESMYPRYSQEVI